MFSMLEMVLTGACVLFIGMLFLNRKAAKDVIYSLKSQMGAAGDSVRKANAINNYNQRIKDAKEKLVAGRNGWEKATALVRSLKRQVEEQQQEWAQLDNRLRTNPREANAPRWANRMAALEPTLETNKKQLDIAQSTAEGYSSQILRGQEIIRELEEEAKHQGLQLDFSMQAAALADLTRGLDINSIGSDMAESRRDVQEIIDRNLAKADVAQQMAAASGGEVADREVERQARSQSILDRYQADPAATK